MTKTALTLLILFFAFISKAQHNVILIIADDLGTDWCGFYEDHVDTVGLPHIRTLLSKGVRFRNAMSNPLCSPTRAGIFTGRYSFRTGVGYAIGGTGSAELDTAEITIPKLLNIYNPNIAKAQIGKWHLQLSAPPSHYYYPNYMGYDHYAGNFEGQLTNYYHWKKVTNGDTSTVNNYATIHTANNAISWIKAQNNKPFFLWLAFNAVHTPYHLPPAGLYSDLTLSGTSGDIAAHPKKYFKAMLEALDHEIGRVFDSLQVLNKLDSTDIIFIGDNGNTSSTAQIANTSRAKGTIYQYGVHVPFIISGPSVINPGRVSDALVNTADLFATILELFGDTTWQAQIPVSKPVDSKSIMPIIKNTGTQIRPWAFTEVFKAGTDSSEGKAIRNMNYKLLNFDYGKQEFYNLAIDAGESNDLLTGALSATDVTNYNYLCTEMTNLIGTGNYCNAAYLPPSVAIAANATTICAGTNVTFTATATNGGTSPTYQWKKNGSNVGSGGTTYSESTLVNGDVISCVLTTAVLTSATSNSITMTVNPIVTPSITIGTTSTSICAATNVTFNATATNGGTSPTYQWKKNGSNVGSNISSYSNNALANGNVISCVLTSNAVCATSSTATSNQITMAVSKKIPSKPSVITGAINNLCNTIASYTYSIPAVTNAISYIWSVPASATIISGQGTTSIVVSYSSLFVSGQITVQSSNYCGVSALRTLNVYARPQTPGAISGLNDVCANQLNVAYSIGGVTATSYKWTVPTGGSIVSGQGTTSIVVNFGTTAGNITVLAKNACANSLKSTLPISIVCRLSDNENSGDKNSLSMISPFTDEIIFSVNSDLNNTTVSLFDLTGREIYQWKNISLIANEQQQFKVDENIPLGIYFLTVKNSSIKLVSKVSHQ